MSVRVAAAFACSLALAGCENIRPYVPPSQGHIAAPATPPAEQVIPPPARISTFVPAPKPTIKPQTYSVVVTEVPVKELLGALARDTRQNIDIHPGVQGLVSLNAIDETLPAILDRISKQVNLRYRLEGNTIVVSPDTPYMKTYRVNYVNVTRNITSTVNVSGEIGASPVGGGAGGATAGGAAAAGGAPGGGGSRTTVTSTTSNDFWEQLRDNVRAILISTRRAAESAADRAARAEDEKETLRRVESAARAGPAAAELLRSISPAQTQRPAPTINQSDVGTDVIVNPIAGTVTVHATEQQHQLIQQHLDNVTNAVQRQVLIEATIVEVRLSDAYQAGIDLARLATRAGPFIITSALGSAAAGAAAIAAGAVTGGLTIARTPATGSSSNISATIKLLEEFGNTRVLSSPKVMTINNQTALLKHVDNIVYFEVSAQQGVLTAGGTVTAPTFTTTAKSVAVGVVLGVTPQINQDGRVTLTVRPTVSRLLGAGKRDPNPSLCGANAGQAVGTCLDNVVPEVQVREMESVLQVTSGQTVILGGLMEDDTTFIREQVPIVGNAPGVGELFRFRNERAQKRELIIFLRPTVITNPSLDSDELKFFQRFLPNTGGGAPGAAPAAP